MSPARPPFGGKVWIADSSAWQRSPDADVAQEWSRAMLADQVATCSIVRLELLFSTRDAEEFRRREADLARLRDVPLTVSVQRAAQAAMRDLARLGPLHHCVPVPDLLLAAAAQEAGLGVLHYDRHYDRLAEVLDFESFWLAEPGSL